MEGQEADPASWIRQRKWNLDDFVDYPYVCSHPLEIARAGFGLLTSNVAPKDQVSRAAKMLAEEFVSRLLEVYFFPKER